VQFGASLGSAVDPYARRGLYTPFSESVQRHAQTDLVPDDEPRWKRQRTIETPPVRSTILQEQEGLFDVATQEIEQVEEEDEVVVKDSAAHLILNTLEDLVPSVEPIPPSTTFGLVNPYELRVPSPPKPIHEVISILALFYLY
jgi:cytochrome P450